jgi:hypothetical protein
MRREGEEWGGRCKNGEENCVKGKGDSCFVLRMGGEGQEWGGELC